MSRNLESDAEAETEIVDALVVLGETAVRDVVDEQRDVVAGGKLSEIERLAEQDRGTEALVVGAAGYMMSPSLNPGPKK